MTSWFAAALVLIGALLGAIGYILWSSRNTHAEHSNYDAATSVRAVQARVMGDRWAKRYGYPPLEPDESATEEGDFRLAHQRPPGFGS